MHDDYCPRRPADFDYNAALLELEEKIHRKKKATSLLTHFKAEEARLASLERERREELCCENADVERLRSVSLAVLLYTLLGKKEGMLAKEEAEALAAAARYETAKNELEHARTRIRELEAELRRLGNCERYYEEMMEEKRQQLLQVSDSLSEQAAALEHKKAILDNEIKELNEAVDTGIYARGIAKTILSELNSAHELGRMDVYDVRRGLPSFEYAVNTEKHDHIARAQHMLSTLERYLQDFIAELGDVSLDAHDIPESVGVDAGTRTLDVWFDNIFTDLSVLRRIESSQNEMEHLIDKLAPFIDRLTAARDEKLAERALIEQKLDEMIRNA